MPAVNGGKVWKALQDEKGIIMACNTRNPIPAAGILKAAEEMDAVVAFELSKREVYLTNIEGLYPEGDHSLSGMTPQSYADIIAEYAKDYPNALYFLHGDHIQIKQVSTQQIYDNPTGSIWDVAVWDDAEWDIGAVIQDIWYNANGIGYNATGKFQFSTKTSTELKLYAVDYLFQYGEFI